MVRTVRRVVLFTVAGLLLAAAGYAQDKQDKPRPAAPPTSRAEPYTLGPDSQEQPGVPKGSRITRVHRSTIYPKTDRDYALYIPANYDASKPHRLIVFQDGAAYEKRDGLLRVPVVLDNLIYKKELPPIICLFVEPGYPLDAEGNRIRDRDKKNHQRSIEYDTLSGDYAKFLEKELIPKVASEFNISKNSADRCICGHSSGGICAFTVAWERPDLFRKVISHIGSFTNIRGGHVYPALVRKTVRQPKPLRVFLQDGTNDLDNEAGNWPLANQEMAAALKFAKYDFRFELGVGYHSDNHGGAILPETLKWIWRTDSTSPGERSPTP